MFRILSMWLDSILETVEEMQMFVKERLLKKYTGVCRWESMLMAHRISRFPRLRKKKKRSSCCWDCLESSRSRI